MAIASLIGVIAGCAGAVGGGTEGDGDTGAEDVGSFTDADTSDVFVGGDAAAGDGQTGDPCDVDDDCDGALFCVDVFGDGDSGLCTQYCADDAGCPDGWECVLLTNSGGDAVELCVPEVLCLDEDDDGYGRGPDCAGPDCDDTDPEINPRAREICDGDDNDCDGMVDDDPVETSQTCDTSFSGACSEGLYLCVDGLLDCEPRVLPGDEVCNGLDDDCDGETDESDDGEVLIRPCYDALPSTEGVGECRGGVQACDGGEFGRCVDQVLPTDEICNGLDDDCDGMVDETGSAGLWYPDDDDDGFGAADSTPVEACAAPDGYVDNDDDCDDDEPLVHPEAEELVGNGRDETCDGLELCWVDGDDDGHHADETRATEDLTCDGVGLGDDTTRPGDCDDTRADRAPGLEEVCDTVDNDCNDRVDDGAPTTRWYFDGDGDTWGADTDPVDACFAPTDDHVARGGDCNDDDPLVHPEADELAGDGVDQNCDRVELCFVDGDRDGYRDDAGTTIESATLACDGDRLADLDTPRGDCDDERGDVRPGVAEIPGDGIDQNCDRVEVCYLDNDGDGYRPDPTSTVESRADVACDGPREADAAAPTGDCDDDDPLTYRGATEIVGDGIDQSCDARELCYCDGDGDGYRTDDTVVSADLACDGPGEAAAFEPDGDCADRDPDRNPGAVEACDGIDNDCDDLVDDDDPDVPDADRDGVRACSDCNDDDPGITDVLTTFGPGGAIPDGGPFSDDTLVVTTTVRSEAVVTDLNVMIDITHEDPYFTRVYLTSPEGTRVTLINDAPCCGDNFIETWLDDEGEDGPIIDGTAPFTGRFVPQGLLRTFDGQTTAGTWTLEVEDYIGGNTGTLNEWRLEFGLTCD